MEKKILSLGADGKIFVKSTEGRQYPVSLGDKAVVYLLIDCSSSMAGEKIEQAKEGASDFAITAIRKGYRVGLIKFDDSASLICESARNISLIAGGIEKFIAMGSTNLTDALRMASERLLRKKGCRIVVVATDGCPGDPNSALEIATEMKKDKIEILAIATGDADQDFLSRLVSRKDLNLKVEQNKFREGMNFMVRKLPTQALEDKR